MIIYSITYPRWLFTMIQLMVLSKRSGKDVDGNSTFGILFLFKFKNQRSFARPTYDSKI
jgi:hypothetical protein